MNTIGDEGHCKPPEDYTFIQNQEGVTEKGENMARMAETNSWEFKDYADDHDTQSADDAEEVDDSDEIDYSDELSYS